MIRDENYNRETQHKIVKEFVDKSNGRHKSYMWECKICNQTFGPTQLGNILIEGRVGGCCKKTYERKLRYEKYTLMENSVINGNKKLIEFVGESPPPFRKPEFNWQCVHCGKGYGPTDLYMIKKYIDSACCRRGKYDQIGYGVVSSSRIKRQYSYAKSRGLDCDLTAEYLDSLWNEQDGRCAYTNVKFQDASTASIDRVDSSKGYLKGNVQWVLPEVNIIKRDLSHDRFLELCSMITNRQKEKENDDSK